MKRFPFIFAALLSLVSASVVFAQSSKPTAKAASKSKKDATPAVAPTPPSPDLLKARMKRPLKGTAYIEIIKGTSKKVGNDIVTTTMVKNVSDAPIVGLRVDEWWYAGKEQVSGGDFKSRAPIAPGEIVEAKTISPWRPGMTGSQFQFTQANGPVKLTAVKKFTADKNKK